MTAHFARKTGLGVMTSTKPTADDIALGEQILANIETKREGNSKRVRACGQYIVDLSRSVVGWQGQRGSRQGVRALYLCHWPIVWYR